MKKNILIGMLLVLGFLFGNSVFAQKTNQTKKTNNTKTTETTKTQPKPQETNSQTTAQTQTNDPVLITIGNEKITKSEFIAVYMKNNTSKDSKIKKEDLQEYLELFINFRLKVKEAEYMKLDTASSFINELAGYRKQLTQPFLIDKEVNDLLLEEAYERSKWDVRASHILIRIDQDANPKDTLIAWNKIMNIRKRIMAGEDFGKVAAETSEDPSARDQVVAGRPPLKGNKGDLGYFSVFDMVYPFETGAYTTPVGQISMPVRTSFGYHLIKVTDKKPSLGKIQVAHLLLNKHAEGNSVDSTKNINKIKEIQEKLKSGVSFEDLVKEYSDDKGSAAKGGMLPWFGPNRMVPEFVEVIYGLKKNEVSAPTQTMYGWHFIKLLDYKGVPSYEESKNELKMKISRDIRSNKSKDVFINRLKKEYKFTEDVKMLEAFFTIADTSLTNGSWKATKAANMNKVMIKFADKSFTQTDFANYLEKHQGDTKSEDAKAIIRSRYNKWVEDMIIEYEDSQLSTKHKEFRDLMKEYRDGILLFELTDQMVWSKAVKDTVGLKEYYEDIKLKYQNPRRVEAYIFKFKDEKIARKNLKTINKMVSEGTKPADIVSQLNKKVQIVELESGIYVKGDNAVIDKFEWKKGVSDVEFANGEYQVVYMDKVLEMAPKPFSEIKGIVISEYQNYLEKEWIKSLRAKYPYKVDMDVFNSIIQ